MADESHAVAFWRGVASSFKGDPGVMFDLFNEPSLGGRHPTEADWRCWAHGCVAPGPACSQLMSTGSCKESTFTVAGMQQLVNAVRASGARQPVLVGGLDWAGDPCGVHDSGGNAGSCMWLKYRPSDPDHQIVASFHTYNQTVCNSVSCWDDSVAPLTRHVPVVTGELGEKDCSDSYVTTYMRWADAHGVSYLVWSWQPGHAEETCAQQGTRLLANWAGAPNRANPTAAAVQSHLRAELGHQGKAA